MQRWRRGDEIGMPFAPAIFGIAIDVAIKVLRKTSDERFNSIIYAQSDVSGISKAVSEAFPQEYEEVEE